MTCLNQKPCQFCGTGADGETFVKQSGWGVSVGPEPEFKFRYSKRHFKYNHRDILKMRCEGKSYSEISQTTGCSYSNISQIIRKYEGMRRYER